ncbi:hypothetical protein DPMN_193089 [Dreissena polymorpha]|uniref:Uncharacterized protein n=1 Tax=Dreissena polymorpha TaxID=45954 RepID=A0A9D4BEW5_DREPO|nr:hypothetical protein DPMN_193089 [Dreissena polymorpha]
MVLDALYEKSVALAKEFGVDPSLHGSFASGIRLTATSRARTIQCSISHTNQDDLVQEISTEFQSDLEVYDVTFARECRRWKAKWQISSPEPFKTLESALNPQRKIPTPMFEDVFSFCSACKYRQQQRRVEFTRRDVVYFTATFPYIVLIIFFVRGVTLRGAVDGLAHMYTPKLERLLEPRVWLDAATQIFFSFGLGFGGLISFSSYNNIHNNCQRDTILISLTNWFTAIFASSVVFAVLGFKATLMMENCVEHNFLMWQETFPTMANISQEVWQTTYAVNLTAEVQNVWNCSLAKFLDEAASGTGLAFIIFTQAIVEFGPSAPFWSIIFFMMLLSLGMGSEFGTIEGFTASIYDLEPLPFITRRKWLVSAIICGSSFLIGLLFVLGSGSYWVALFDQFSASFPLLLIAMMECVTIGWIYGVNKFGDDIEFMIGSQPNIYWKIIWKFVAPIMVAGLLVATLISYFIEPLKYEAYDALTATMIPRDYPWYGVVIAFILVLSSVGCIPVIAILRRLKILNWNYAKQIQAEEKGYTQSTAKFLRSATSVDDDNDGRSGEEAIVRPYTDNPDVRKHSTQDGAVTFTFKE